MNRIHNYKNASTPSHREISKKIAIHEAGHAVAICLGNQQKKLPPVFFQIVLDQLSADVQLFESQHQPYSQQIAKIEGGRLIEILPPSLDLATRNFSMEQKLAYQRALEADIINILAGPLAEAKYIALRDDELMNPHLVNLNALQYYGGSADLAVVNQYLDCVGEKNGLRETKANELFLQRSVLLVNNRIGKRL